MTTPQSTEYERLRAALKDEIDILNKGVFLEPTPQMRQAEVNALRALANLIDHLHAARAPAAPPTDAAQRVVPKLPEYHSTYPDSQDIGRCNYDSGVTMGQLRAYYAALEER